MYVQEGLKAGLTFMSALSTWITSQLSVENAMANRAAENRENIEAKHKVTALQNAMVIEEGVTTRYSLKITIKPQPLI